jgi:hypothetical protein
VEVKLPWIVVLGPVVVSVTLLKVRPGAVEVTVALPPSPAKVPEITKEPDAPVPK